MKRMLDPLENAVLVISDEVPEPRRRRAPSKPKTYKVICISAYDADLKDLDDKVRALKARGFTKANRSSVIRMAIADLDVNKIKKEKRKMHALKHIIITDCEGPTLNHFLFKNKKFTSYRDADKVISMLAPRDEDMPGCYKCFVQITFDDDTTYEAKLELTWSHRCRASIVLPHVISHCEVMSGRVVPPHFTSDVSQWERILDEMEGTTPGRRAQYGRMLDEYFV